ncbi:hypothetical protein DH2020_049945 [Rehmannia glutinosa]|uniref:Knl1 C-terminal RWD domain-containing protein n=1 Tax=Rehmannia glutinosa TaxID=99300 RepID=A0ABR0U1D1_REHGL
MDSKEEPNAEGHRHNTGPENSDTMALQKKRARRVSFAEMTSIHFFDRDEEDNETPLMETEKIGDESPGDFGFGGLLERNMEFGGEDGGNDNDEDEEMDMHRSFLRPVGSPSPGGSTFGSASSNDGKFNSFNDCTYMEDALVTEDNFFGPVSANFIRPGRLSDSAASDDNHDVTMDSTAFSMHYRSLARSESGVDLKTPTGGLFFEEKTPTDANIGSSMIFTLGKRPIPKSSMQITEVSGSHNSNDMSLVEENPNKYDYEKLSPGLDALLAESRKNLLHVSVSNDIITSPPPKRKEGEVLPSNDDGDNFVNLSDCQRKETGFINSHDVLNEDQSAARIEFGEANGAHETFPSPSSREKFSSNTLGAAASSRDNYKTVRSPYQLSKVGQNGSDSPLVASTSSPAKRQQTLLTTASPSKHWELASPLPQLGSLLGNESVEHQVTETSIQKSISKLELLERSAFSSAFSAKIDNSTVKTLDFLKSPNFDSFLEKNRHISRINFVEDSFTEEKSDSVHQSKERSYAFSTDHARAETLNHISGENNLDEHLGLVEIGNPLNELSAKSISRDQLKYGGTASSPSKITLSGNNLMRNLLTSKHSNEDALMTETESLLAEIASGEGGKAIITSKFVSSPDRMLEKKLSASPDLDSRDSTPERKFTDVNISKATAHRGSVSKGMKGELSSPFVEVNRLKNLIEIKSTDNREADIYNGKEIFGTTDNVSTPAKEKKSQVMYSKNLDVDNLTRRDMPWVEENLSGGESRAVSVGPVSPSGCRNLDEPRSKKNLAKLLTASPSRTELDDKLSSGIPSPKITQLSGRLESFSTSKRNVELLLRDAQHRTEMTLMQRSPKLQKGGNCDPETMLYSNEGRTTLTGHERKKWIDTYSKFSEDMKILVSGSADKLNSKMIDVLEDMLVHQQKSKIYEMLHLGVMPQNTIVCHDVQLEKIAETNSLLHQVVFKRANLLLKHVKRERLLKRLQLLSSRIKESQVLRENNGSQPLEGCTTNVLVDAVGDRTLSVNLKKGHEVSDEKLTAVRQALEALDRKILNLTRTFHVCCKMKTEPSCADTVALVNEHLIKRASCRFIRLDMQMWVVHGVGSVNGQHNVFLNYLDFIIQSIKIIVGPTSSASVSFKLNETNIIKSFPNMDACTAFAFVFNAETASKYIGAKTLARETQVSSSLLGTLLDVVEEVQLAQMEFQNLTQSSFCSPSAEQLHLMLCFVNFNSGRKVILTLDMSCLKRGIYPSEALPLQLGDSEKCSSYGPIFDEIKEAIKGVKTGYMRILRLCKCVSQVVQASRA